MWKDSGFGTPVVTEDYRFIRTSLMLPLLSSIPQKLKTSGKTSGKKTFKYKELRLI